MGDARNMTPQEILRKYYGYRSFRTHQLDIIETVIRGQDAFVLMPTGSGKSICYQIPAILRPGVGLVVSPLIALMQDQVQALRQNGLRRAVTWDCGYAAPTARMHGLLLARTLPDVRDRRGEPLALRPRRREPRARAQALRECWRVLRPGGRLLVLEFSKVAAPLAPVYDWYSFKVLPLIGRLVAKDADSYRYLAESIRMHPDQAALKAVMKP